MPALFEWSMGRTGNGKLAEKLCVVPTDLVISHIKLLRTVQQTKRANRDLILLIRVLKVNSRLPAEAAGTESSITE
jgi:hypothetical protein